MRTEEPKEEKAKVAEAEKEEQVIWPTDRSLVDRGWCAANTGRILQAVGKVSDQVDKLHESQMVMLAKLEHHLGTHDGIDKAKAGVRFRSMITAKLVGVIIAGASALTGIIFGCISIFGG